MKSIIITGKQGVGKTELAKMITEKHKTLWITVESDLKDFDEETEAIVFDAICSEKDFVLFKAISSKEKMEVRPYYSREYKSFKLCYQSWH